MGLLNSESYSEHRRHEHNKYKIHNHAVNISAYTSLNMITISPSIIFTILIQTEVTKFPSVMRERPSTFRTLMLLV